MRTRNLKAREIKAYLNDPLAVVRAPHIFMIEGDTFKKHLALVPFEIMHTFEHLIIALLKKRVNFEKALALSLNESHEEDLTLHYLEVLRKFLRACRIDSNFLTHDYQKWMAEEALAVEELEEIEIDRRLDEIGL